MAAKPMTRASRKTLNVRDERTTMKSDAAARWLDGEVEDRGGYVAIRRRGRFWTVGKGVPNWECRVKELLA